VLLIVLLGTLIATIVGIISGLIPGLHINNIIYLISSANISLEIKAIVFILSSVVFCFISIIPATIFSIPNTDNFVSTMPAQKLFLRGKGFYAIYLYCTGAINAIIFGLPLIALFLVLLKYLPTAINLLTPFVLLIGLACLFFQTKNYFGYLIIIFSGLVGYFSLQFAFVENPLLVIVSGLFGASNILFAMQNKIKLPKQSLYIEKIDLITKIKVGVISPCLSIFVSLFPGLGNGFATYFGTKLAQIKEEGYILMNGAINVLVMILSFFCVYFIGKTRTASAVFFENFTKNTFVFSFGWILFFCLIGVVLGYFLTIYLSKKILVLAQNFNYKIINILILAFLHLIVLLFSNFLGLVVFWVCTLIGYLCIRTENPRLLMISCIIVPVLIYFV